MRRHTIRPAFYFAMLAGAAFFTASAQPTVIYSQSPNAAGGLYASSRLDPDGNDNDQYIWDNFSLQSGASISEIVWQGGYNPAMAGSGGPVADFSVAVYASLGGSQPDMSTPPLFEYRTGGNAGETPAGVYGGTQMYEYGFTLPAPFQANAGTYYWVQIEAYQNGVPDWGVAAGAGGEGRHFRRMTNGVDMFYQIVSGDAAFTLIGTPAMSVPENNQADEPVRVQITGSSLRMTVPRPFLGSTLTVADISGRILFHPLIIDGTAMEIPCGRTASGPLFVSIARKGFPKYHKLAILMR